MSKKFLLALLAVLCAISPSLAQTQSDDVVRITTNLVQIDVVVTKKGKPIKDLKADDFEIFEDGRPQEITSFVYVSNVANNGGTLAGPATTTSKDPNAPADPNSPRQFRRKSRDEESLSSLTTMVCPRRAWLQSSGSSVNSSTNNSIPTT